MAYTPLVVLSHLRWDFVFQRPQHLMTRMARHRRVYFIEEPLPAEGSPHWRHYNDPSGVTVLQPMLPAPVHGWHPAHREVLGRLLTEFLRAEALSHPLAWLYTPMAMDYARLLDPSVVVYDCMDELSLFRGAPANLVEQEAVLMQWADLVFTGGPSLYRAKRNRHPRVHCFPSSVDADHFRQARPNRPQVLEPDVQRGLAKPRLGFFGVLDERLDLDIVDALARRHQEWEIVMVGPVVKIDPATLPRHPNLHYFGQQPYAVLPGFLRGWDVCLLPFARNEATRFISPTKTLEYMAAERPIVSTPIRDVADLYADVVGLGDSPDSFVAACERALALDAGQREAMTGRMREIIAGTSWERTAARMTSLIELEITRKLGAPRLLASA